MSCFTLTFIVLSGYISGNHAGSVPGYETIGCWKDQLNFTYDDLSHLLSLQFSNKGTFQSRFKQPTQLIQKCSKFVTDFGYSVFFMNYKDGGKRASCITGAHAGHLYTNYQSSMSQNCDVIRDRTESAYVYSVIGALSDELNSDELSNNTSEQSLESSKDINNDKMVENLAKEYYLENSSPGNLNTNPPVYSAQNQETYFPDNFDTMQREGSIYRANNPISNQFDQPSYTYAPSQQGGYGNVPPQAGGSPAATSNENMQTSITLNDLVKSWLNTGGSRKPEKIGEEIDELNLFDDIAPDQPPAENILRNPSFEHSIVPNSLNGWLCEGGLLTQYSSDHHGVGLYSGRCSNRVADWAGPGQYIGRFLKPSTNYKFSAWVRLETKNAKGSTKRKIPVEVWLRYRNRNQGKLYTKLLAKNFHLVNDQRWKNIVADFQVPRLFKRVKYVFLYIKGPSANIDIIIDDSKLTVLPKDENWKKKTDSMIEKIRKRNVTIDSYISLVEEDAILSDDEKDSSVAHDEFSTNEELFFPNSYIQKDIAATRIQVNQTKNYFGFGAALNNVVFSKKTAYENYKKFFLENFEWATLESAMKWWETEPERGHVNYTEVDELMHLLLTNNFSVRGHCIFWALPEEQPKWLPGLPKPEFREAIQSRLDSIVSRYKTKVRHWDVNNEMLHGEFYVDKLNDPSIREWMFHRVRELDPGVKPFLNDFEVVASGLYTQRYVDFAKELQKKNIPIEGIGAQGHFTGVVDPFVFKDRLDTLKEINLPIWLTEVDIVEKDPHKRAISLENVMRVGFSHPSVHGIILWCFWNLRCWRGPDTGLVDGDNFTLTEAGRVYQDLRQQWTTNEVLTASEVFKHEGIFKFRGFHGDYDMFIHLPDGKTIKKSFELKPGNRELIVKVNIEYNDLLI